MTFAPFDNNVSANVLPRNPEAPVSTTVFFLIQNSDEALRFTNMSFRRRLLDLRQSCTTMHLNRGKGSRPDIRLRMPCVRVVSVAAIFARKFAVGRCTLRRERLH